MRYYLAIMALTWMSLGVLCILVHENDRMTPEKRRLCYIAYGIIGVSSVAEVTGVLLDGVQGAPSWLLYATKWVDYTLTPWASGAIVAQMGLHNRWNKILNGLLVANTLFQAAAFVGGWMITVDANNHYEHGPMYMAYTFVYVVVLLITLIQFSIYGRSYRKQNRASLYAIVALIIVGIALQELLGSEVRVAYLALSMGVTFLFIHNAEFFQLKQDKSMAEQREQLMTDTLTGTLSRYAYSCDLRTLEAEGVPQDLAVFSIDVNGLKDINDTRGHAAGDELIRGAATCIQNAFGSFGRTYRTGGDEFVVLANMGKSGADETLRSLEHDTRSWKGTLVPEVNLAAGYALACDYPELVPERLVTQADKAMYAAKSAYYRASGKDRRRA